MRNEKIELKIIDLPSKISERQERIHQDLISQLEKLMSSYEFILNAGVIRIGVALVYNKNLSINNPIIYDKKISLFIVGFPKNISEKQDIKNSVFRADLDFLLKNYKILPDNGIEKLSVLLYYNRTWDEIKLLEVNDDKNEEGLAFFAPTVPKFRSEQVVINEDLKEEIQRALILLKKKSLIYEDWGFNQIDPEPKAIINFYGPPGTGKTMTAHAIASELECQILALNYADIESKFVGDAPKNLVRAFETASKDKALLFFDEADSFLGKRIINVSSSSDQAVNSLRSQMLILLENFEGIVVFATNLITNYDRAFESRIFKHIKFELPDADNRTKIISQTIPQKVPFENGDSLSEEQVSNLVELSDGFSGREIKNAILDALTHAVADNRHYVYFSDFKEAFQRLKANQEKLKNDYAKDTNSVKSNERKQALETKIKQQLDEQNQGKKDNMEKSEVNFLRSLLDLACHAALSDGVFHKEEQDVIQKTAKAFEIEYEMSDDLSILTPIEELYVNINTKDEKTKAIDFVFHIIVSNGHCTSEEQDFMRKLCKNLCIGDDEFVSQIVSGMIDYAEKGRDWNYIKSLIT